MVIEIFWSPNFLNAPNFSGTHNFNYIRSFTFSFFFLHFLFNMYDSNCFGQLVHNISKKMGERTPCTIFCYFCNFNFFAKQNMSSNQVEREIIKQNHKWDDHTIRTWDYEGEMSYIS